VLAVALYDSNRGSARAQRDHTNSGTLLLAKRSLIAVVDDDESMRQALSALLSSLGYAVAAFESGERFLTSDRRQNFACLIADVQMPLMTGPELHARLIASGDPIPIVFITAHPDPAIRSRAFQSGAKGYLIKPFSQDDLVACVNSALDAGGNQE
jgi:FixJ family two-component response regulator